MASPALHRPLRLRLPDQAATAARRIRALPDRAARLAQRDRARFFWLAAWAPFWLGSDVPAPEVPGRPRHVGHVPGGDPAGIYLAEQAGRMAGRFTRTWIAGSLLRGLTLALLVLVGWVLLSIVGLAGLPGAVAVTSIVVAGVAIGGVYGWLARPDRLMVAVMLDRTFRLRERLVTAFDRPHDDRHISRLQLADAANSFHEVSTEIPRSAYLPIREAALFLIAAGALLTVLLTHVPHQAIGALADDAVPQFVPASERLAPQESTLPRETPPDQPTSDQASIADIQERGRESQDAREDLARVGEALEDHALTRPAAESIANGDYAGASESLQAASSSVSSMSQEDRDALADDLEQAAQDVAETNPELAEAAQDAADAVRKGGPEAEQALNDLGDQIEQTGDQVESQDDLARDLDEAESDPSQSGNQGADSEGASQEEPAQGSDQGGEGGNQGDPGQGQAAEPGVADQGQPPDSEGSSEQSSGDGSAEQGSGQGSASQGEPSDDAQSGQGSGTEGESTDSEGAGDDSGMSGEPDDETGSSQGSGGGTGQDDANDQGTGGESPDGTGMQPTVEAQAPGQGEAGDPPPGSGEESTSEGTQSGSQGSSTLELEGTSDEGVQTGGDSGTSSLGSGSDASSASGNQGQANVGLAGPDSNRVPDSLRDIVRDYFEEEP